MGYPILICTIIILSFGLPVFGEIKTVGHYNMIITTTSYDYSSNTARADVGIDINLPSGTGFVYMPLPFLKNQNQEFIIEPTSNSNLVLFGYIRPTEKFSVCQIALQESETKLFLTFRDIAFSLNESAQSGSNKALNFLLRDAHYELMRIIKDYSSPRLQDLVLNVSNFQDSKPSSESLNDYPKRKINFSQSPTEWPTNVIIFLNREENKYLLFGALSVLGILIGYFTAPKLLRTKSSVKNYLILTSIGIVAIIVTFFVVQQVGQWIKDTTTVVTVGTGAGLLIGLWMTALNFFVPNSSVRNPTMVESIENPRT